MPTYDFVNEKTLEPVELWFSMSDAPRIGDTIDVDGARLRRVVSIPQARVEGEINFKCWQVSGEEARGAKHYDTDGCPVFTSKSEVRQFLQHQQENNSESATYGDGWSQIKP